MSTVPAASTVSSTVRTAFNFNILKAPLCTMDGWQTPHFGLFNSVSKANIGQTVSKDYVPHTTDDVIALTEAAQHAFDSDVSIDCHFDKGHYVKIQPNKDYRKSVYGTNDNVYPRILINASLNGRAFRATMGWYRDLCMNMSMMTKVKGTSVSIRHMSNLRGDMDSLIATFNTLKESWGSLEAVIDSMQAQEVNLASFLDAVYGEPTAQEGRGLTIHRNRTEEIMRRVQSERLRSGRPTLQPGVFTVSGWEAYNAVQGFAQHKASRNGDPNSFGRIVAASSDRYVKKAEELVLAM